MNIQNLKSFLIDHPRGTTVSSVLDQDFNHFVLEGVSIHLDILTLEVSAMVERLPRLLGCKQILHQLLVLRTQEVLT